MGIPAPSVDDEPATDEHQIQNVLEYMTKLSGKEEIDDNDEMKNNELVSADEEEKTPQPTTGATKPKRKKKKRAAKGNVANQDSNQLVAEAHVEDYQEYVEKNEQLLEAYIALGVHDDLEQTEQFLRRHGDQLLTGTHAGRYLLLDCLIKAAEKENASMKSSAKQYQLLLHLRDFSKANGGTAHEAVNPAFRKLMDQEQEKAVFLSDVRILMKSLVKRAVDNRKGIEAEEVEVVESSEDFDFDPEELLKPLPHLMRQAFRARDMEIFLQVVESLPRPEAKRPLEHMARLARHPAMYQEAVAWINTALRTAGQRKNHEKKPRDEPEALREPVAPHTLTDEENTADEEGELMQHVDA